jgi:hypothetical protein
MQCRTSRRLAIWALCLARAMPTKQIIGCLKEIIGCLKLGALHCSCNVKQADPWLPWRVVWLPMQPVAEDWRLQIGCSNYVIIFLLLARSWGREGKDRSQWTQCLVEDCTLEVVDDCVLEKCVFEGMRGGECDIGVISRRNVLWRMFAH